MSMHDESEREVLGRIDATRARMGETIEQIGDRVNPARVQRELKEKARAGVRDVKDNVKDKARHAMQEIEHGVGDAGRGIWDVVRENPIPAGMVGVGLAWLVANGKGRRHWNGENEETRRYGTRGYAIGRGDDTTSRYSSQYGGDHYEGGRYLAGTSAYASAGDVDEEGGGTIRERAGDAMESTKEKAAELKDRATERMHDVQDRASRMKYQARYKARRIEHRLENAVQQDPLTAGVIALAAGFAAGMMIPETEREREMFGDAREKIADKAQDTVRAASEKAREAVKNTAGESARRAVDEVWPGGEGNEQQDHSDQPRR